MGGVRRGPTLEEIAHLVWLESGARVKAEGSGAEPGLRELFGRLSGWAWSGWARRSA